MVQKRYKRRNYFIKKDFQGKYIFTYFINVLVGSIIFALILSIFSANTITVLYDNYTLQVGLTPTILLQRVLSAHWLFIILGGSLVVVGSMLLTHRVAGPMFRFEKTVDQMIDGNFGCQIILRTKDEGKDLADRLNHLNKLMSIQILELLQLNDQMQTGIEALRTSAAGAADTLPDQIENLQAVQDQVARILNRFTIKEDSICR